MELLRLDTKHVRKAYARWAPVYDFSFGAISNVARQNAVDSINQNAGRVLEVGVGTGLSLPRYGDHLEVTGIDLSADMLQKARERVKKQKLTNVAGIHEMDAAAQTFPDNYFDTVVAMFVMTVVPEPEAVMSELERVCAPGGSVLLLNHFFRGDGVRGFFEREMAKHARLLGWHADFPIDEVMAQEGLELDDVQNVGPLNLFTILKFRKDTPA